MKKKGFTLVEMLAVVAILGIIVLIATPIITKVMENSKMNAFKASVNTLLRTISNDLTGLEGPSEKTYLVNQGKITPDIEYEGEINGNGFISIDYEGKTFVQIYDGVHCIYKTKPQKELHAGKMTQEECNQALIVNNALTLKKGAVTTDSITVLTEFNSNKIVKEYYFAILTNNSDEPVWISNNDKSQNYYTFSNLTSRAYTIRAKAITTDDQEYEASLLVPALVDITANITITPTTWSTNKTISIDFGVMNSHYTYRYRLGDSPFVRITTSTLEIPVTENNTNFIIEVLGDNQTTVYARSYYINTIDKQIPSITAKNSNVTAGFNESINLPGNFFSVGEFGESGGTTICRINGNIYNSTKNLAVGTYTLQCSAQANNGALPVSATTTLNVINLTSSYAVSNSKTYQEFTASATGYYQIEAWGGQGGNSKSNADGSGTVVQGGKGAYTKGQIFLNKGEKLYIYVGEKGNNGIYGQRATGGYNGGALGGSALQGGAGGGGATDIRYFASTPATADLVWNSANGLNARIMVAAGGGGAANGTNAAQGGDGGTLWGENGILNLNSASHTLAGGGRQNVAGTAASNGAVGAFGIGGASHASYGGGGGGGYYGGGGGGYNASSDSSGAGGSSFISGYAGVNSITSARAHTLQTVHFTGKHFKNSTMTAGINQGNGKVKISYISSGEPAKINENLVDVKYVMDCTNGRTSYNTNIWVEIQAIYNGANVAKGRPVLGTSQQVNTSYPYSRIVDGDITYSNYAYSLYNGAQCAVIDLGDNYDLEEIAVWHYYQDFAPVKDNYTYVSKDMTNWKLVLKNDSNDTASGNRVSAYSANEVKINANYTWNIAYTGNYQALLIPTTGYYQVELWGAKGGNSGNAYGAYTKGTLYMQSGEYYYLYIGGAGSSGAHTNSGGGWNGGGNAGTAGSSRSGGGATDIRCFYDTVTGKCITNANDLAWNSALGLKSRIMVAGGGGSGENNVGGIGGALTGGPNNAGSYATQTSGSAFGYAPTPQRDASGAGGGYWGGILASADAAASGGGSSFISGHIGCVAIASSAVTTARADQNGVLCTNTSALNDITCSYHYSSKKFTETSMTGGTNTSHGKAQITFISE